MIIVAMLLGIAGLFTDTLSADHVAYWMLALTMFAIAQLQFGPPPKYEDLADLLDTKLAAQESTDTLFKTEQKVQSDKT